MAPSGEKVTARSKKVATRERTRKQEVAAIGALLGRARRTLTAMGARHGQPRVGLAFALASCGAVAAGAIAAFHIYLIVHLSWAHSGALANSEIGINFSCNQAEYLLLEDPVLGAASYLPDSRPGRNEWCAETLGRLLRETGVQHVRLSVEWSQVEPEEGRFDFGLLDALLTAAQDNGASVVLGVGIKGQRSPEFYIPDWVEERATLGYREVLSDDPVIHDAALAMVATVVRHTAGSPALDAWQADNEPYIDSARSERWSLSPVYVREVVATIRANDPNQRPISINHAQHWVFDQRWRDALADSDALAASLYPFRNHRIAGIDFVVNIVELGPLGSNYRLQGRLAHEAGKPFWITELQAEPWTDGDARLISPENPSPNLSPAKLRKNIEYGRRAGADRLYLWGAEWWLFQEERYNDSRWMETVRAEAARSQSPTVKR
jgi:hypothetical protein